MIRTNYVKLNTIRGVAYREKRAKGDTAIVLLKVGQTQPGIAGIGSEGNPIITDNTPAKAYPEKSFKEAIKLTHGMPYHKQGKVIIDKINFDDEEEEIIKEPEISEKDYEKVLEKYTDKNGKFSYELINKDAIKFLNSSEVVKHMIEDNTDLHTIHDYVVGVKIRDITGNHDLTLKEVNAIVERLDAIYSKGIFKDFDEEIKKKLAVSKKNRI